MVFCPSTDFCQQTASRDSIFVTHNVLSHKSVAFFTATDIGFFAFEKTNHTSNPFESRIFVIHFYVVLIGNRLYEFCCHNGLYHILIAFHLAHSNTILDDVVKENHTSLISIHEHPFAFFIFAGHTHTVSIGVRSHHDVSINFLCEIECQSKCFSVLGIGRHNSGEISIFHHLFCHGVHVFKSPAFKRSRNQSSTGSVKWSIDNAQILLTLNNFRINAQIFYSLEIGFIDISANRLNKCRIAFELYILYTHFVHLIDNPFIVGSKHLRTIFPISLISIILFRIVRRCEIHT